MRFRNDSRAYVLYECPSWTVDVSPSYRSLLNDAIQHQHHHALLFPHHQPEVACRRGEGALQPAHSIDCMQHAPRTASTQLWLHAAHSLDFMQHAPRTASTQLWLHAARPTDSQHTALTACSTPCRQPAHSLDFMQHAPRTASTQLWLSTTCPADSQHTADCLQHVLFYGQPDTVEQYKHRECRL